MSFEVYDRSYDHMHHQRSQVSVRRGGDIAMNQPAYKAVQEPEAVVLMYDRTKRSIAIKPCAADDVNAFRVRRGWENGKMDRSATVCAKGFLRFFKLVHDTARRYNARYDNGMLVVDLPGQPDG